MTSRWLAWSGQEFLNKVVNEDLQKLSTMACRESHQGYSFQESHMPCSYAIQVDIDSFL